MDKITGIYRITNLINNKHYIGQSVDIYKRWTREKGMLNGENAWNTHLQSAWKKYGSDNFEFVIIERCDKAQLNQREMYWIEQYDSFNNGYNKTIGGDGAKHITPWNKGLKLNEEYRRKLSESHKGHIHTEEHKSKISAKVAGENNPNYGKTGVNSSRGVCIYCETLNVYFGSYASAEYILLKDYGIKIGQHTIADAAKGLKKTNTAGKTADGVPLVWRIVPEEEKNKNIKLIINS